MQVQFEVAAGSVVGKNHSRPLLCRNNQDAYGIAETPLGLAAVVADGCSSGLHSEVGAKIGVRLLLKAFARPRDCAFSSPLFWEAVRKEVLGEISNVAWAMGGEFSTIIADYFLFTLAGALLTPKDTYLFSIGDAFFCLNGEPLFIGPFPENEPPYCAYALVENKFAFPELLSFQFHRVCTTSEVHSVLVGTDGVADLWRAADKNISGREEIVGPLSQFWQDDRYFKNPDTIRRRLALMNQEVAVPDWVGRTMTKHMGILPDDTTMIVIRRRLYDPERR